MSDTPDVPRSREKDSGPHSEADLPSSPHDTPTVEFRERHGRGNPGRIDVPPTPEPSRMDPAFSPIPSPLTAEAPPELANHPRYRVVGMLGKGGMGMVYKAEHRVMKRFVALKVIASYLVAESAALARFRREIEAAATLSHPNIVTAHDAEQAGECHFLVMELVDGISFDLVLKRKGPLPVVFACDYIRQAALGLQHAHEHGMVHRDIKLQNLMLTRKGQVKILDFGLARFASESGPAVPLTECGTLTGTPDFIAPEQAEDARRADIRADIYSLGCTFYALLTGQLPFPGGGYVEKIVGHLKKEPAPLTSFRDDLPAELIQIVGRMMAKDPGQRFQTPDEVAKALLPFRKAGTATASLALSVGKDEGAVRDSATVAESPPASANVPDSKDGNTLPSSQVRSQSIQTSEEIALASPSRSRSGRRRKRSSSRHNWRPIAIGAVLGMIGLLSLGGVLLVALSRGGANEKKEKAALVPPSADVRDKEVGQVMIVSRDPHVQVAIRRGIKIVGTISREGSPEIMLPAGEYELEVVNGGPETRGFTGRLSLARGDRKVVEVRLEGILVRNVPADFRPPPPVGPDGPPPPPFGGPPRPQ